MSGPPGDGGDHGNGMEEKDDVKEKRIGNGTAEEDFENAPRELIAGPEQEGQSHRGPENPLRT